MNQSPTVYVVDAHARIRESLEFLIRSVDLEVVTVSSTREFFEIFDPRRVGCMVLDVRMPAMSGLQLQEELKARGVEIPIIFITGHGDVALAVKAMKAGAVDFLQKPVDHHELLERIHEAILRDLQRRSIADERAPVVDRMSRLTSREYEVLERVVAGKTSKQIAEELSVGTKTVEAHRARIMAKLAARNSVDLVRAWHARH